MNIYLTKSFGMTKRDDNIYIIYIYIIYIYKGYILSENTNFYLTGHPFQIHDCKPSEMFS